MEATIGPSPLRRRLGRGRGVKGKRGRERAGEKDKGKGRGADGKEGKGRQRQLLSHVPGSQSAYVLQLARSLTRPEGKTSVRDSGPTKGDRQRGAMREYAIQLTETRDSQRKQRQERARENREREREYEPSSFAIFSANFGAEFDACGSRCEQSYHSSPSLVPGGGMKRKDTQGTIAVGLRQDAEDDGQFNVSKARGRSVDDVIRSTERRRRLIRALCFRVIRLVVALVPSFFMAFSNACRAAPFQEEESAEEFGGGGKQLIGNRKPHSAKQIMRRRDTSAEQSPYSVAPTAHLEAPMKALFHPMGKQSGERVIRPFPTTPVEQIL
uniref:Transmembrane protein n=1 Tax=Globodera rostochiensis TaxID=31243 RepID=A0A914HCN2_GLORO